MKLKLVLLSRKDRVVDIGPDPHGGYGSSLGPAGDICSIPEEEARINWITTLAK